MNWLGNSDYEKSIHNYGGNPDWSNRPSGFHTERSRILSYSKLKAREYVILVTRKSLGPVFFSFVTKNNDLFIL
jgi:hypothetical protein